jgi:hypothetical protein
MSLTKFTLAGNNLIISSKSLVSDILTGDWIITIVEDCILVINTFFISYMCLAIYGASEAVYPCVVVEKIHESF